MRNVLLEYMNKRAKKEKSKFKHPGPVITISRQYGCYATTISRDVAKELSEKSPNDWNYITKEILEDAALKLNVKKQEIAHIFGANEKSFLGDLIVSFSKKKYTSDSFIKKTINSVVRKYAEQGNCIIVGRAGCIIAKDIHLLCYYSSRLDLLLLPHWPQRTRNPHQTKHDVIEQYLQHYY